MTFAVQGPTASPQVLVNPLSLVAPGIFRDIFQMTSMDPTIQVRDDGGHDASAVSSTAAAPETPAKKSKSKTQAKNKKTAPKAEAQAIDGWSSTTRP
jgi:hypothetical protein